MERDGAYLLDMMIAACDAVDGNGAVIVKKRGRQGFRHRVVT